MTIEFDALTAEITKTKDLKDAIVILIEGLANQFLAVKDTPQAVKALSDSVKATERVFANAVVAHTEDKVVEPKYEVPKVVEVKKPATSHHNSAKGY